MADMHAGLRRYIQDNFLLGSAGANFGDGD
jgi:hypothetical protein